MKYFFYQFKASIAQRHPYNLGGGNRRYEVAPPTHDSILSETYPVPTFAANKLTNPWLVRKYSPPPAPLTPQQLAATTIGPSLVSTKRQ